VLSFLHRHYLKRLLFTMNSATPAGAEEHDWTSVEADFKAPPPYSAAATSVVLDDTLMTALFPDKDAEKRVKWLKVLTDHEFSSVADLRLLKEAEWAQIDIPLAVKVKFQSYLAATVTPAQAFLSQAPPAPIAALDVVVMDVSSSMKAMTAIDPLKTREDLSKVVFHVFVDKMLGLEMNHGVGLLAFGQTSRLFPITRNYESFHDELGRLDANQSSTRLYDSIREAGEALLSYASEHKLDIAPQSAGRVPLRVFVLTDGEDNASLSAAWQVAQWLQDNGIVLDSLPLAGPNKVLQAMSTATNGLCFRVVDEQQALGLFEGEAVLHLASREQQPPQVRITSQPQLLQLCNDAQVVEDVRVAVPAALSKPAASKAEVQQLISKGARGGGAVKRITRELTEILSTSDFPTFVVPDDLFFWRVVLQGPAGSPYEGRFFLVTLQFPNDYPFKPPKVRFQTRVYHTNINNDGGICLDILKDAWSPALTASKIMITLRSLLADPNFADPLDTFKAQTGMTDRPRYDAEARKHAAQNAAESLAAIIAQFGLQNVS